MQQEEHGDAGHFRRCSDHAAENLLDVAVVCDQEDGPCKALEHGKGWNSPPKAQVYQRTHDKAELCKGPPGHIHKRS